MIEFHKWENTFNIRLDFNFFEKLYLLWNGQTFAHYVE